jgi:predicted TIM-barrel fold metal-dependent hydrolase
MIIDTHHHMLPLTYDEAAIAKEAERRYIQYGPASRAQQIDLTVGELRRRLIEYTPDPDGAKLIKRMDKAGIDITFLCVMDNVETGMDDAAIMAANRTCAEIARKSGGRIMALVGVEPRRKGAPELYRRCIKEYGMKGLKWHCDNGYYPNTKEAYAILKVAEELGTPLLTHTGPLPATPGSPYIPRAKYADVSLLDEVAQDFPGLKIIAAHMGRHQWRKWAEIAQFRRNVYGDLAMWQIFAVQNYERFCRDLRDMLDIAGTDSILFGSDGCGFTLLVSNEDFIRILRDLPRKAPAGIKFTDEEIDNILGKNAQKVYGL